VRELAGGDPRIDPQLGRGVLRRDEPPPPGDRGKLSPTRSRDPMR